MTIYDILCQWKNRHRWNGHKNVVHTKCCCYQNFQSTLKGRLWNVGGGSIVCTTCFGQIHFCALNHVMMCRARHNPEPRSEVWWWNLRWSFGGKCFWQFSQQKKLENLLPNFAGSSPPSSPKTSPTSLWKSLVLMMFGSVPATPDPDTFAKVSRYKWEPYRDTYWWCIYYFLPSSMAYFWKKK